MAEHVKRLRDCVMAGKKVDMDEMNVIMDGTTVPRSALTNMLMFQYAPPPRSLQQVFHDRPPALSTMPLPANEQPFDALPQSRL